MLDKKLTNDLKKKHKIRTLVSLNDFRNTKNGEKLGKSLHNGPGGNRMQWVGSRVTSNLTHDGQQIPTLIFRRKQQYLQSNCKY